MVTGITEGMTVIEVKVWRSKCGNACVGMQVLPMAYASSLVKVHACGRGSVVRRYKDGSDLYHLGWFGGGVHHRPLEEVA